MHSTHFSVGKNTFLEVCIELLFRKTPTDNINKTKGKRAVLSPSG